MLVAAFLRTQFAQHFKAVHAGHHHVKDRQIQPGAAVLEDLHGFTAVRGLQNAVAIAF